MTILDHEQLECVHNLLLHRDRLHRASVHIPFSALLGSDTQRHFTLNQITVFAAPFRSMPLINIHT